MFEFTTWHAIFPDFFISLRHYTVIGNQLLLSNYRNRVRRGLSQDGACIDLFENLSVNSLKGDLSNATTFKLPLFSLDKTFNLCLRTFYYSMLRYVGKVTTLDTWQTPHKMRMRKEASTPRTPTTSSIPIGIFLTRTAQGKFPTFSFVCLFRPIADVS
jgi:hypothetical protein